MVRFLLMALLLSSQMAFCAEPVIESDAPVIKVVAQVADVPARSNPWLDLLSSPAVIMVIASLCVQVLKNLHAKQGLDTDRWVGLVHHLYGAAESAGALKGNEKLKVALELFDQDFFKTYGKLPKEQDRADIKNDLARLAYADPRAGVAPTAKAS